MSIYACCLLAPHYALQGKTWIHLLDDLPVGSGGTAARWSWRYFLSRMSKSHSLSLSSLCEFPSPWSWGPIFWTCSCSINFLVLLDTKIDAVFDEVDLKLESANYWRDSHFPGFPGSSPGHTAQDAIGLFCCQDVRLAHAQLWKHDRVTSLVATYRSLLVWSFFSLQTHAGGQKS